MLVVAWDECYDAIQRIKAAEYLAAYQVAVAASPYLTDDGAKQRDALVESWKDLVTRSRAWIQAAFRAPGDFGGPGTPEGASRADGWFPPLAAFGRKMSEILGHGMRD